MKASDLALYLVTDRDLAAGRDLEEIVAEAVGGGVTMVQLREKECSTREFIELASRLKKTLAPLGVPLIINDRADVALAVDADGLHIGQSDMPYQVARRILGPDKIIGLSVENMAEMELANQTDVDYVAVSPVFDTATKTDTAKAFGLEGTRRAVAISAHPTVAIGGINRSTCGPVIETGIDGVAVVSAIVAAPDPRLAAYELKQLITNTVKKMKWTQRAWNTSSEVYKRITEHPFITEMMDGSLPVEKFTRYLAQDEIYIGNYGAEMYMLADMIPAGEKQEMFRQFAESGIEAEKAMHALLIERFSIDTAVEPSRTTTEYMNHTRKAIESGDLELSLAAMLPCMWIYNEVGRFIVAHSHTEGNSYAEWIAAYSSDEFTEGVDKVLAMIDELAAKCSPEKQQQMLDAYLRAAELEWEFWDYGYRG